MKYTLLEFSGVAGIVQWGEIFFCLENFNNFGLIFLAVLQF